MSRIKFNKKGAQRIFLKQVMFRLACPSISELANRLEIPYGTLKCYFSEARLFSLELFHKLCFISDLNKNEQDIILKNENWGQIKGGKNNGPAQN